MDERIRTGLPYDLDMIIDGTIQNKGAIVDVNQINFGFDDLQKTIDTTFIYLRNTNFDNVSLDFSNVNKEQANAWLQTYITSDIIANNTQLNEMWIDVVYYSVMKSSCIHSLPDETLQFIIEHNKQAVDEFVHFIGSLLIFVLYRLNEHNDIDFTNIRESEICSINKNLYAIIDHPCINDIALFAPIEPLFYKEYFTNDNDRLFEICVSRLPYNMLIYGMVNDKSKFKEIIDQAICK